MNSRQNRESGSATAEFAILFPIVAVGLVAAIGVFGAAAQDFQLTQNAGVLARAVELGKTQQQLAQLAARLHVQLTQFEQSTDGLTCITAQSAVHLLGANLGNMEKRVCALAPGF